MMCPKYYTISQIHSVIRTGSLSFSVQLHVYADTLCGYSLYLNVTDGTPCNKPNRRHLVWSRTGIFPFKIEKYSVCVILFKYHQSFLNTPDPF